MNSHSHSEKSQSGKEAFLGSLFQQHGEWIEAKDHWLQALSLDKKQGNDLGIAQASCNLGLILEKLGEIEKGYEYLQIALQSYDQLNDLGGKAITLNNLGLLNKGQGKIKAALDHFEQAHLLFNSQENLRGAAAVLGNIAGIYQLQGNLDKADSYYARA